MATAPFVIIPSLSAIAVAYPQGELIADKVLPRVGVDTELFRYAKYGKGDAFRTPETLVGRKSAPNQLDWSSTEQTASTQDHGLDAPIPNKDIEAYQRAKAAGAGYVSTVDPESRYAKLLTGAVLNRREKRTADLVFGAANYAVGNKVTLSGISQWSDYTNSDPIGAIEDALNTMVVRPNYATFGQIAWSKTRRNPGVIQRLYGSASTRGSARIQDFAEELGLREIFVGSAFLDTSAPGQTANLQRAWGPHASFFYRSEQVEMEGQINFGFTAQWGDRIAGVIEDPDVGLRGGKRVRSGESVVELVTAPDLGYLFSNVVS